MKTTYPEDDKEFLSKLDALIADNLNKEKLSVAFLAGSMCMSVSTFFRRVKEATGMGCKRYVRTVRLQKVLSGLKNARGGGQPVTISNIAIRCGFSSLSAFDKAFRKDYGISPSEYIAKYL